MAFTERYVTQAAGGGGSGTIGSPWTLTEAVTNAVAGDRVNILSDGAYSIGTMSPAAGTASGLIVWRGYDATIGDLDNLGRNSDGTLNTTGFPAITLTGIWVPNNLNVLQNLNFTGALSSHLVGGTANDRWTMKRCSVTNTQNNAAARAALADNFCTFFGCDFYCSGAAHASVVDMDTNVSIYGCRIRGTSTSALLTLDNGGVDRTLFIGNASSVGIVYQDACSNGHNVTGNTFYGIGTAITWPNVTPLGSPLLLNNHVTDCSKWIDNLHSATAAISVIEGYNRIRDVTTPRTGVETVTIGEVTTDTGGAETDYTNAAGGNFILISGAPGRAAGSPQNTDIGAYQRLATPGGYYQLGVV
jgi:hypothetical protein